MPLLRELHYPQRVGRRIRKPRLENVDAVAAHGYPVDAPLRSPGTDHCRLGRIVDAGDRQKTGAALCGQGRIGPGQGHVQTGGIPWSDRGRDAGQARIGHVKEIQPLEGSRNVCVVRPGRHRPGLVPFVLRFVGSQIRRGGGRGNIENEQSIVPARDVRVVAGDRYVRGLKSGRDVFAPADASGTGRGRHVEDHQTSISGRIDVVALLGDVDGSERRLRGGVPVSDRLRNRRGELSPCREHTE